MKCLSVLLDYCVNNKQQDVIQLVNNYDETPLHVGVLNNSIEPVKLLIEYGASIDIADDYGETPLHNAVYNDNEVMAELLLRHKANPNYLNKIGLSPFHIALTKLSLPMVKIFLEYGADLSCAPFKDISCMVVADLLDAVYNQCDNKHDKSKLEDFVLQLIEWLNFGYAYKDGYEHAVWGSKCKELNTKLLKVQLNQVKALMTLVEGRAQISKITPDFDYRDEETELAYTLTIGDGDTDKLTHLVYYILNNKRFLQ